MKKLITHQGSKCDDTEHNTLIEINVVDVTNARRESVNLVHLGIG